MSRQVIETLSPAKLNLFLHVTGQRDNGYHELQTAFQLLDWGDRIRFEITETPGITLHPPVVGVPNEDNLIFRAAAALGLPEDRGVAKRSFRWVVALVAVVPTLQSHSWR